uniref:Alpha-1,4-N-acetylglucosaminyltransferase n=1 Tax=Strigamia maritima TaxID=126957 RepID=T1IQT1_STRMM
MLRKSFFRLIYTIILFFIVIFIISSYLPKIRSYFTPEIIDFSLADNITGFADPIVPNIIHFFKFRNHNFTFTDMICLLAAWCNQQPNQLLIHCDCVELEGPYWNHVKNLNGVQVHPMNEPRAVFGRPLSSVYHAGDIARLVVLSRYGGIALDFDTYVIQSLDKFRHYELSLGWSIGKSLGCQIIIAHKDARFLKLWIDSYRSYRPQQWYYNAGDLPTKILERSPYLVHRVPFKFGVDLDVDLLYKTNWPSWRRFYAIHLLLRHRSYLDQRSEISQFNEENIRSYSHTFGEMARMVLYGSTDAVNSTENSKWSFDRCQVQYEHRNFKV